MQEILLKVRYFKRGLSNNFKVNFIFLNSVSFNGKYYEKRSLEQVTSCSGYKTSLEKFYY